MSLYQLHRPKDLSSLLGNEAIKQSLGTFGPNKPWPHAILLTGGSGCGKTTIARIIKSMLGCSDKDYAELNAANTRGIDTIREIGSNAVYAPMNGKVKVYLMDECHAVTGAASEALLKLLEDSPKHCYFILCTTNPEKLITTIKTRCSAYQVESLKKRDIVSLCRRTLEAEGADATTPVLTAIAKVCDGSARKALVLLESIIGVPSEEDQIRIINASMADESSVKDLIDALIAKVKWPEIAKIIKGIDAEPEAVRRQILGYLNAVLLNNGDGNIALLMTCFEKNYYDLGKSGLTMSCFLAIS